MLLHVVRMILPKDSFSGSVQAVCHVGRSMYIAHCIDIGNIVQTLGPIALGRPG